MPRWASGSALHRSPAGTWSLRSPAVQAPGEARTRAGCLPRGDRKWVRTPRCLIHPREPSKAASALQRPSPPRPHPSYLSPVSVGSPNLARCSLLPRQSLPAASGTPLRQVEARTAPLLLQPPAAPRAGSAPSAAPLPSAAGGRGRRPLPRGGGTGLPAGGGVGWSGGRGECRGPGGDSLGPPTP